MLEAYLVNDRYNIYNNYSSLGGVTVSCMSCGSISVSLTLPSDLLLEKMNHGGTLCNGPVLAQCIDKGEETLHCVECVILLL